MGTKFVFAIALSCMSISALAHDNSSAARRMEDARRGEDELPPPPPLQCAALLAHADIARAYDDSGKLTKYMLTDGGIIPVLATLHAFANEKHVTYENLVHAIRIAKDWTEVKQVRILRGFALKIFNVATKRMVEISKLKDRGPDLRSEHSYLSLIASSMITEAMAKSDPNEAEVIAKIAKRMLVLEDSGAHANNRAIIKTFVQRYASTKMQQDNLKRLENSLLEVTLSGDDQASLINDNERSRAIELFRTLAQ